MGAQIAAEPREGTDTAGDGSRRLLPLDEHFLARTYRTTGVVAAIIFIWIACVAPAKDALNFVLGTALSLALLRINEVAVRVGLSKIATRGRWAAAGAYILKYGIVGAVLWFLFHFGLAAPAWIAAGYFLLLAIVTLKIIGIMLNHRISGHKQDKRAECGG